MVKITIRALKIGVQLRFYQISTEGFRTFFPENFGQAYYVVKGEQKNDRFLGIWVIILRDFSLPFQITNIL